MKSNNTHTDVSVSEEPSEHSALGANGTGELEKVRNILFGEQIRMYDDRIARLEERLKAELLGARTRIEDQVSALEEKMEERLSQIDKLLAAEGVSRSQDLESIKSELSALETTFSEHKESMDTEIKKMDASLRETIVTAASTVVHDFEEKTEILSNALEDSVNQLQKDKINRTQLSEMLAHIAKELKE